MAEALGISDKWAWMRQVHGDGVAVVAEPGLAGESDALVTTTLGLPLAVTTADCVPVVMHARAGVAVVHAGWRGLAAGVIDRAVDSLREEAGAPVRAAIGPSIGPCCYEVGDEVVSALGVDASETTWGSPSVDLWSIAESRLAAFEVWRADLCTHCEADFHSYRESGTDLRQTSVGWL